MFNVARLLYFLLCLGGAIFTCWALRGTFRGKRGSEILSLRASRLVGVITLFGFIGLMYADRVVAVDFGNAVWIAYTYHSVLTTVIMVSATVLAPLTFIVLRLTAPAYKRKRQLKLASSPARARKWLKQSGGSPPIAA